MKITEIFNLEKSQHEIDFVNIDINTDIPLFIDPAFLAIKNDKLSFEASKTIRHFFQHLIDLISRNDMDSARRLFENLDEPNETRLGVSISSPKGKGVGSEDTQSILDSLIESKAIESGLVEELEDCLIFVDGFGKDKLSDMTTNIIKKHLIDYTINQCELWGIPLTEHVPTGFYWNRATAQWENSFEKMLVINSEKIILTPKSLVSFSKEYTPQKYHQHFVLNFLQNEQLKLNTTLVQKRRDKDGKEERFVTKKSLIEHGYTSSKGKIREFTKDHPEIFSEFKQEIKSDKHLTPIGNDELQEINDEDEEIEEVIDYLIDKLEAIPSGAKKASDYHRLTVGIVSLLFYPKLTAPQVEQPIHEGRKRIDFTFDNSAGSGFFHSLHTTHQTPAQYIFFECKNYSEDPKNPELDQLSGRFSWNRGKFGILMCREINDMNLFLNRCRDTLNDDRGTIIPLTDEDLKQMLLYKKQGFDTKVELILNDRLRKIKLG
ncbi:hypothetical protein [Halobacillus sp. B29]|uniref:hypothetical protein n=1 Tax=Halobacillus sp. B29 TaxID=3457432 RepID=UPI003FCD9BB5